MEKVTIGFKKQKIYSYWILVLVGLFLCSCSYIGRRNKEFDGTNPSTANSSGLTVPKEEYDALLAKYNQLSSQNPKPGSERVSEELINELSNSPKTELAETIDVFEQPAKNTTSETPSENKVTVSIPAQDIPDSDVEGQFNKLKKAQELIMAGQYDEALGQIKRDIENSPVLHVRVKAKFLLGELLLKQNEYDLAQQMFEEIVNQYAFSGLVIKTLGRLIHCSEKLKQEDKKAKYYSMLNDIFGTG